MTLRRRWPEWLALALYIALGVVLLTHHEAWRDEADSWLMARDAPLWHIPLILGRAGTPMLWYALLLPFARLGFPYITMFALNMVISAAAAAVLLFRSHFHLALRLLLVFSYFLGYEYLAVARSYALMILLLFAMAAAWGRPLLFAILLALFVNTTVHALLIGVGIALVRARELRGRWAALVIIAAGIAVAGLPIAMAREQATVHSFGILRWKGPLQAMAGGFMPLIAVRRMFLFGIAVFIAASVALWRKREALVILWLSWGALFFIYTFVYIGDLRHFGLLLMTLVFALWVGRATEDGLRTRPTFWILYVTLIVSTISAARTWSLEVRESFSGSKEMAAYIAGHGLADRVIAAHPPPMTESVLAYLPRTTRFVYPALGRVGSYMEWDPVLPAATDVPNDVAVARAGSDLVLVNGPLRQPGLRLLYANRTPVFVKKDETFWLYAPAAAP
jgi:hypothetical protein